MNTPANDKNVVALPSIDKSAVGAIVYWRLSGDTNYEKFCKAWEDAGLDPKILPDLPSPRVALNRACQELATHNKLEKSRHPSKNGWILYGLTADEHDVVIFNKECHVHLDAEKKLVISPSDHPGRERIELSFREWQNRLAHVDMGQWLAAKVVSNVKAVSLRDSGGIYFVPRPEIENFEAIKDVIHHASANRCFEIPAVKGEEALDAILDAVIREAEAEAKQIEDDLKRVPRIGQEMPKDSNGKELEPLGARALRARAARCEAMTAKVEVFEELLDTRLDQVRDRMESLQASAVESAVLVDAQNAGV